MISKKMADCVAGSSAIRAMFEDGKKLAAIYGAENVYDFSLGNPSLNPPPELKQAIIDVLEQDEPTLVHGYMNNSGYEDVRDAIAKALNKLHGTNFTENNIIMTVGAAGGLNVILKTLVNPDDEIIAFAPFFGEYRNYAANFDAKLVVVPPSIPDFQPNLEALEGAITAQTKMVIINTPNNPTGVIYSEETLTKLGDILRKKQKEFGSAIYLLADEPYRELAYDNAVVPYVTKFYENTIVGYSYSKSLSLPGERIGYLVIPSVVTDYELIMEAAGVATRILGFVNAPSLIQRAVGRCQDAAVDVASYDKNRVALYEGLTKIGYECVKPQGAFYLFVKCPIESDPDFCEKSKEHQIILVPGSAFGCPGYIRIAYCVPYEKIINSLPKFEDLFKSVQ